MVASSFDYPRYFPHGLPHRDHNLEAQLLTPRSVLPPFNGTYQLPDAQTYADTLALLPQSVASCMIIDPQQQQQQQQNFHALNRDAFTQKATATPAPGATGFRQDSFVTGIATPDQHWVFPTSMGVPAVHQTQGLKGARSGHRRTPSASTTASNSPASPYMQNCANPQIANTDFAPSSPAAQSFADQSAALFSKNLPTPTQTPFVDRSFGAGYTAGQATDGAHEAMKGFAIDHHMREDTAQDFPRSARQSMSNYGNELPATPQSGAGDVVQSGHYNFAHNDYRQGPSNLQLFRTESQAYQDELFNPDAASTPASAPVSSSKSNNSLLSPYRNLVNQRLHTANMARSQSPSSAPSRERSPFRDGSPLAPTGDWRSSAAPLSTAAGMRQQQKEQAEQAELSHHHPTLQREPTKTISPKDALLDYNEQEPSLFQDNIPAGYKAHFAGTEQWPSNCFVNQPGAAFGTLQAPTQAPFTGFRATTADGYSGSDATPPFTHLPPDDRAQLQNGSYLPNSLSPKMASSDPNPEFPAHLTSMESSISDSGPPLSSQDNGNNNTSTPQRPADTRAGTGTYTCTYHGCTQRFDSHANLQKHKREAHRSQHTRDASGNRSSSPSSVSPRSTESPAPSGAGMTSAALAARNSQAGPHKCTRINPTTNKPCNTIFSRPYDLTRHEDTIHNNRKQKVRCPMCREEKTFSRNDALTRHMRVVHPEIETFGKRSRKGD